MLGIGCLAAQEPDEAHATHELLALTQPGVHATDELPARALLVTTLVLARSRLILLNVSIGDQAEIVERDCQCPLQRAGRTTHLHTIRSFEKLTAGGMTFFDADLVRVLEEALPQRFGGGPTDYQLVEEEGADGGPRVRLLVHPRLGPVDPELVRQSFLEKIGSGTGANRVNGLVWQGAQLPIVERAAPLVTPGGKVQLIHRVQ